MTPPSSRMGSGMWRILMDQSDRFRGCLLGLAVGDAVGMVVQFHPRGTFEPVTDMIGGGVFKHPPGAWTDDTSMALCLATSLIESKGFDARDQMDRYCRWVRDGYLSSTGYCFDLGGTVNAAVHRYLETGDPYAGSTDPMSAGNGCIMRLAPIPMFYFPDIEAVERYAAESSRTTHGTEECVDACRLFGRIICRALEGRAKDEILLADADSFRGAPKIAAIARGEYLSKGEDQIRGTGYVVESLEAALWCFNRTGTFREAILTAVNLGDDADTTAAVCGQVAGAFYGESGTPAGWLEKLVMMEEIGGMGERLGRKDGASSRASGA